MNGLEHNFRVEICMDNYGCDDKGIDSGGYFEIHAWDERVDEEGHMQVFKDGRKVSRKFGIDTNHDGVLLTVIRTDFIECTVDQQNTDRNDCHPDEVRASQFDGPAMPAKVLDAAGDPSIVESPFGSCPAASIPEPNR